MKEQYSLARRVYLITSWRIDVIEEPGIWFNPHKGHSERAASGGSGLDTATGRMLGWKHSKSNDSRFIHDLNCGCQSDMVLNNCVTLPIGAEAIESQAQGYRTNDE
jgi:hypothetical protein